MSVFGPRPQDLGLREFRKWAADKPHGEIVGCTDSTKVIGTPIEEWLKSVGAIDERIQQYWPQVAEYLEGPDAEWMEMIKEDLIDNYGPKSLVTAGEVAGEAETLENWYELGKPEADKED